MTSCRYIILSTSLVNGMIPMLELTGGVFQGHTTLLDGRVRTWTLVCLLPGTPSSWQMSTLMDEPSAPLQLSVCLHDSKSRKINPLKKVLLPTLSIHPSFRVGFQMELERPPEDLEYSADLCSMAPVNYLQHSHTRMENCQTDVRLFQSPILRDAFLGGSFINSSNK